MTNGQLVLVSCKIARGAFSGERVFRLAMDQDPGEYIGIAPVDHCTDSGGNPLAAGQPPVGQEIDGCIETYLITNGGDRARVELPDGEAIAIRVDQIRFKPGPSQRPSYVPV